MKVLGLDVGGAYVKWAVVDYSQGRIRRQKSGRIYFPFWKNPCGLSAVMAQVQVPADIEGVGVTTTADASDAYPTKKEAVNSVLDAVSKACRLKPLFVLTTKPELITVPQAKKRTLEVASANWAATAWLLSRSVSEGLMVDVGSTTTDIIPIKGGKPVPRGKTDFGRLKSNELLYVGALRTNVCGITNTLNSGGNEFIIPSEYFACVADVHRVLGNISESEYSCETPDGRWKDMNSCLARIARVLLSEAHSLPQRELKRLCASIHAKQVALIADSMRKVLRRESMQASPVYGTGVGSFLIEEAADKLRLPYRNLESYFGVAQGEATCIGLACMVAEKLK